MIQPSQAKQYTIEVPTFSGPLDLLLHLIDRDELDITVISLAKVTQQYLAQVELLKEDKVPQLIDFIVVGARLMLIKSRALLPTPPVTLEGEEEEDPAEALLRQLRVYRQFKRSADYLQQRESAEMRTYVRVSPPVKIDGKLDLSGVTTETLLLTMMTILQRHEQRRESVSVAAPRVLTIEDQIAKLRMTARTRHRFPFSALLSGATTRIELSVTLLAVLELIKRHEITAEQQLLFGPIEINRGEPVSEQP